MTPIQLIDLLINLVCDPFWRIAAGLVAGLIALIIWRKWQAAAIAGAVGWAILTGIAYLLNLPLGPPLPTLPTDYTQFWILVGAGFAAWEFLKTLAGILLLLAILNELKAWSKPGSSS